MPFRIDWKATLVFAFFVLGAFVPTWVPSPTPLQPVSDSTAPLGSSGNRFTVGLPSVPDGGAYDPDEDDSDEDDSDEDDSEADDSAAHCYIATVLIGSHSYKIIAGEPASDGFCLSHGVQ